MTRITGQQARDLLDGTTPGPWQEEDRDHGGCVVLSDGHGPVAFVSNREGADPGEVPSEIDGRLLAAAPDLAETVAWLYDRIREIHNDQRCWADAYRAPIEWDPHSTDPARLARAEAHDDCADMLATILDDEEARRGQ